MLFILMSQNLMTTETQEQITPPSQRNYGLVAGTPAIAWDLTILGCKCTYTALLEDVEFLRRSQVSNTRRKVPRFSNTRERWRTSMWSTNERSSLGAEWTGHRYVFEPASYDLQVNMSTVSSPLPNHSNPIPPYRPYRTHRAVLTTSTARLH